MSEVLSTGSESTARAVAAARAPLRIVLNGRFLSQPATGVQRYARETVLALDRLLGDDAELRRQLAFELVVPRNATPPELRHIAVRVLPWLSGHPWEQIALPLHARSDYVVNFGYSGPLVKRRQLITLHDASVRAVAHSYSWRYRVLHETLVRALRRRVDTIMTVSQFSRDELVRRYGIRAALVGYEGWQHSVARGDGLATLRKYGLRERGYLLTVGSRVPHKNLELLESALAKLDDFPLPCVIAGTAPPALVRRDPTPTDRVRVLGHVSDEELAHLYRHAAWLVLPSTYEGFGLPALEAMGNGCPVLAAHAGAIPEVCGDAALYFDPGRADELAALLQRVARDGALRNVMVERGFARLKHFSWAANARVIARRLLALPR